MLRKEFCKEKIEDAFGGKGTTVLNSWLSDDEMPPHLNLVSTAVVSIGGSVGNHEHHGEAEIYYIKSGQGEYNDNGNIVKVMQDTVVLCRDGECHGIVNTGDRELEIIAIIIKGQ
jgi:mannose-6-phosphate isomerase-like protein (cupin superfamily)